MGGKSDIYDCEAVLNEYGGGRYRCKYCWFASDYAVEVRVHTRQMKEDGKH